MRDSSVLRRCRLREAAFLGKGRSPKRETDPFSFVSGTYAEYAADCHESGALSVIFKTDQWMMTSCAMDMLFTERIHGFSYAQKGIRKWNIP